MFLTPLKVLRKTSTKLWCCARSCDGRYEYGVVTGKEVITNKPHVVLKTLRSSSAASYQAQMPFSFMFAQPKETEEEDNDLQGASEN